MDRRVSGAPPRRRTVRRSKLYSVVLSAQLIVLALMGMGIGAVGAIFYSVSGIDIELSVKTSKEDTKIFSSDGVVLASLFQEEHRERVPLDKIPENLRNATVAIEDSRFYKHAGVDIRGISRALYQNVLHQSMAQGGSTLTQQLARNVYLTKRKTFTRKLQEAALAVRIESQYSKNHILEVYLNQVYYGSGAYGVQTASKIYFDKDVDKLDLAQCALLAGLPRRPSYYSPFVDLEQATRRRNTVLQRMEELGYITKETALEAQEKPVRLATKKPIKRRYRAGYFVDYVVAQLIDRYGEDLVTSGGLRVYTTLNWRMQQKAEEALANGIGKYKSKKVGQGTLIAIEPGTGHIKAMVGGTSYAKTQFNRATQAYRQPGSAFKAFVYTAAIDRGVIDLNSTLMDTPKSYPAGRGKVWSPKNYDGKFRGAVSVKKAVALSINLPAIKVADQVGINEVIKYAHMMGINTEIEPYLPAAIGGIKGLRPIEMAAAYAVFASEGIYAEPLAVTKVTDTEGGVIEQNNPVAKRVLNKRTASMMDELFREVVTSGTGRSVLSIPEARGKTGTTNRDVDVWFIGYVPNKIATAVWAGNDDNTPMNHVAGSMVCAPIWKEFTAEALKVYGEEEKKAGKREDSRLRTGKTRAKEEKPELKTVPQSEDAPLPNDVVRVTICAKSHLLANRWCPETYVETFSADAAPKKVCDIHGQPRSRAPEPQQEQTPPPQQERAEDDAQLSVETVRLTICADTGKIATRYCPRRITKTFTIGSEPSEVCNLHQRQ